MTPITYLDLSRYIKKLVRAIILADLLAPDDKDRCLNLFACNFSSQHGLQANR